MNRDDKVSEQLDAVSQKLRQSREDALRDLGEALRTQEPELYKNPATTVSQFVVVRAKRNCASVPFG